VETVVAPAPLISHESANATHGFDCGLTTGIRGLGNEIEKIAFFGRR
jgi:hypothetical protein